MLYNFYIVVVCDRQLCGGLAHRDVVASTGANLRRAARLCNTPDTRQLRVHVDDGTLGRRDDHVKASTCRPAAGAAHVSKTLSHMQSDAAA